MPITRKIGGFHRMTAPVQGREVTGDSWRFPPPALRASPRGTIRTLETSSDRDIVVRPARCITGFDAAPYTMCDERRKLGV